MAKKREAVTIVRLQSTASPHSYYTTKNRRTHQEKLELRKYDPVVRRHVVYREAKKV
jgi:large subunit ribosomal protein L33